MLRWTTNVQIPERIKSSRIISGKEAEGCVCVVIGAGVGRTSQTVKEHERPANRERLCARRASPLPGVQTLHRLSCKSVYVFLSE